MQNAYLWDGRWVDGRKEGRTEEWRDEWPRKVSDVSTIPKQARYKTTDAISQGKVGVLSPNHGILPLE